jgi:hypothetical protein
MRRSCNGDEERLSGLVDGELPEREQRQLAAHALTCPECSRELGRLVATKRLMARSERASEPPPGFLEEMRRRLDEVDGMRQRVSFVPARARRLVGIAAVGVILISGALMVSNYLLSPMETPAVLVQAHERLSESPWGGGAPGGAYSAVSVRPSEVPWRPVRRALLKLDGALVTQTIYQVGRCPVSLFEGPSSWRPLEAATALVRLRNGLEVASVGDECLVSWEANGVRLVLVARTTPEDLVQLAGLRRSLGGRSPGL